MKSYKQLWKALAPTALCVLQKEAKRQIDLAQSPLRPAKRRCSWLTAGDVHVTCMGPSRIETSRTSTS